MTDQDKFSGGKVDKGGVNERPMSPRPDAIVCPQVSRHRPAEGYQPTTRGGSGSPPKGGSALGRPPVSDDKRIKALAKDAAKKFRGHAIKYIRGITGPQLDLFDEVAATSIIAAAIRNERLEAMRACARLVCWRCTGEKRIEKRGPWKHGEYTCLASSIHDAIAEMEKEA